MPDIRTIRPRTGVRIYLYPADMMDMITQPEVLSSFTKEELIKIAEATGIEINYRENGEKNDNANS